MPIPPRIFVKRGFGEVAAESVVDLPGNELRMLAQFSSHQFDNALGMGPIEIAVQANGAPRAFVPGQPTLIDGQNFRVFFREPDRRGGSGRCEDDLDVRLAQNIHYPAKPAKVTFVFLRLADAPGEFPNSNDVNTAAGH